MCLSLSVAELAASEISKQCLLSTFRDKHKSVCDKSILKHVHGVNLFFCRCPSEAEEDDQAAFSDTAVAAANVAAAAEFDVVHRQRRRSVPPSTAAIYCNEPPVKTRPPVSCLFGPQGSFCPCWL